MKWYAVRSNGCCGEVGEYDGGGVVRGVAAGAVAGGGEGERERGALHE